MKRKRALLVLADGLTLEGYAIGKIGAIRGELCFNTGMTGYQEIFTDPSYYGQILIATHTHIGNYGVLESEMESDRAQILGLVVNSFSDHFSRQTADGSLQDFLEKHGVVGIAGIDTRRLVRHIRNKGAMNALISSTIDKIPTLKRKLAFWPDMEGTELASKVSTEKAYDYGDPKSKHRIAAIDYGIKRSILRNLSQRDCYIRVFPAQAPLEEMLDFKPDGFFLSNGPGDPAAMDYAIETVKQLLALDKPLFGICLGHQLICLALGIPTYKMHHGHRGSNHPVVNLYANSAEITCQNHGFAVDKEAAAESDKVEITHINLNDHSLEGIRVIGKKAFSVQYHPEASPGPHDSHYLFDDFVALF